MARYYKAGARYFVAQASHHDHFFNYASRLNRFNSVDVGPHKDICGLWKAAADKYGLPFGLTEHLAASFSWWRSNKDADDYGPFAGVPYDGNDPAYRDFYHDNYEHVIKGVKHPEPGNMKWVTGNGKFRAYWLACAKEMIDLYTPELFYSDSALPFGEVRDTEPTDDYQYGLEAVSYLYNKSIEKWGSNHAVYTQKNRNAAIYKVGTLDIEKSQLPGIAEDPWQTDTCIGNWFYDVRQKYKKPSHIVEMMVDIISKNGTMLLNVLQKPDGTIDEEEKYILNELAGWFSICGEAVYGTRPWRVSGEGFSCVKIEGFKEEQVEWNETDYRFVQKEGKLFAFMMKAPASGVTVIRSLHESERVSSVRLLGYGPVGYSQYAGVLTVQLPEKMPVAFANALEIKF